MMHMMIWRMAILAMLLFSASIAQAQVYPRTDPHSFSQSKEVTFKRGKATGNLTLFDKEIFSMWPVETFSQLVGYSQAGYICQSSVDPSTGSCPGYGASAAGGNTLVTLRFTERRSRISVDIYLWAWLSRAYNNTTACAPWHENPTNWVLANNRDGKCNDRITNGTALSSYIPPTELNKIPTGGIWEAKLVFLGKTWSPRDPDYPWVTNITLKVTDDDAMEVYLPQFRHAKALVDLNLRSQQLTSAPGALVSGVANVDLCLYDGYNSNSKKFTLTVKDDVVGATRTPEQFSVVKLSGVGNGRLDASIPANRIDYSVEMKIKGAPTILKNGDTFTIDGVDLADIRAVRLSTGRKETPTTAVVCTPAPLTFRTPAFNQLDKKAGRYQSTLNLIFTPSTTSL